MVVRGVHAFLQQAWNESFPSKTHCREQGGYIYADQNKLQPLTALYVARAPPGQPDNQQKPVNPMGMAIDLNHPGTKQTAWVLVANFHTHPLHPNTGATQQASKADQENNWFRKVPGIVLSREGVYKYGDTQREDWTNPQGYPPYRESPIPASCYNSKRIMTGFPKPTDNQWEPGRIMILFPSPKIVQDDGVMVDEDDQSEYDYSEPPLPEECFF